MAPPTSKRGVDDLSTHDAISTQTALAIGLAPNQIFSNNDPTTHPSTYDVEVPALQ